MSGAGLPCTTSSADTTTRNNAVSPASASERRTTARGDKAQDIEVTISNAGASDIAFELDVNVYPGQRIVKSDLPSRQRNGRPVFAFNVPHNAAVTLHLSVTDD